MKRQKTPPSRRERFGLSGGIGPGRMRGRWCRPRYRGRGRCLFGLLSVSGLRLGEARNLEIQDVDLKTAVLTIRGAKFGKTRLCLCMHRPARCLETTSPDVSDIGQDRPTPDFLALSPRANFIGCALLLTRYTFKVG